MIDQGHLRDRNGDWSREGKLILPDREAAKEAKAQVHDFVWFTRKKKLKRDFVAAA
jgi:hypothetical protein